MRGLLAAILAVIAGAGLASEVAHAQLISPGRLIEAHADLEGVANCTSCHALGQRGVDPRRCLDCHTPLRTRIEQNRGFHATVSSDCGSCHKDHFGRDFDPIRLDRAGFDHDQTGYPLEGAHATVDCQSCHRPAFITAADVRAYQAEAGRLDHTFLGVTTSCQTCHRDDNVHGPELAVSDCSTCHTPARWSDTVTFAHEEETGFALVGAHSALSCASCHAETATGAMAFTGLSTTCRSCHADRDPHGGQFRGRDCASCHGEQSWRPAARFDHSRSRFALTGSHRRVDCASCHGAITARTTFVGLDFAECSSCHADPHDGAFDAGCASCHSTAGWRTIGEGFDVERFDHDRTRFPLIGAHAATACQSCHGQPPRRDDEIRITFSGDPRGATFPRPISDECASCHLDAHEGQFVDRPGGIAGESCHTEETWRPTTFDLVRHTAETRFPLAGGHVATPCFACHGGQGDEMPHFAFESTTCESCHASINPHGEQFADATGITSCGNCHDTARWDLAAFDHSTTSFPLTGAHTSLSCRTCHAPRTGADGVMVHDFGGLDLACASCHARDDPHRDQFAGLSCDSCHDTQSFTVSRFDHSETRFPLEGAHRTVSCASCHATERAADGTPFVRFVPLPTACASCHAGSMP